jgi:uncharacterized Zn finger protein
MDDKTRRKFADLAWQDLEEWAGTRVVARAKGYKGEVEGLCVTENDFLLATVHGSRKYTTKVGFNDNGKLSSICTCPYGSSCKHAVAMVLVFLDAIKKGETLPVADSDDRRFKLFAKGCSDDDEDFEFSDLDDDEDYSDGEEVEYGDDDEEDKPEKKPAKKQKTQKKSPLKDYLDGLDKGELVKLVMEFARKNSDMQTAASSQDDSGGES